MELWANFLKQLFLAGELGLYGLYYTSAALD